MNATRPVSGYSADQLIDKLAQVRGQLRALIDCLPGGAWLGPRAGHLNPPLWEYGHIVWFQERWCLRAQPDGGFAPSLLAGSDALYDSSNVSHAIRWDLPLLDRAAVDDYAERVSDAVAACLRSGLSNELAYFAELSLYHELMHIEAWWMAFQNLGYAPPFLPEIAGALLTSLLSFAAGAVELGSGADSGFIFDNEKWRHTVHVAAFDIDASPVSETAFAKFVAAGGYQNPSVVVGSGLGLAAGQRCASSPVLAAGRRRLAGSPLQPLAAPARGCADAAREPIRGRSFLRLAGRQLPTAAQWRASRRRILSFAGGGRGNG